MKEKQKTFLPGTAVFELRYKKLKETVDYLLPTPTTLTPLVNDTDIRQYGSDVDNEKGLMIVLANKMGLTYYDHEDRAFNTAFNVDDTITEKATVEANFCYLAVFVRSQVFLGWCLSEVLRPRDLSVKNKQES